MKAARKWKLAQERHGSVIFNRKWDASWRLLVNRAFIGFRTMKLHYDIIDPKITKNLSNRLYQSRPPHAKKEHDVIDKPVKPVIR